MFVISLDFELLWGVHDVRGSEYYNNIKSVKYVLPVLLDLFDHFDIKSSWATVGAISLDSKEELSTLMGEFVKPLYVNKNYSPFDNGTIDLVTDEALLFSPELIKLIVNNENAELASHTFSHYYVLEDGQSVNQFECDCLHTRQLFNDKFNTIPESIVFPRNQVNDEYLKVLIKYGIKSFRGTPRHWAYISENRTGRSSLKRFYRLLDCFIPITKNFNSQPRKLSSSNIYDIPATIFLRPYSKFLSFLEPFKIFRIKYAMKRAAKRKEMFHLWWHPHNFSSNLDENISNLYKILNYQNKLNAKFGWPSKNMSCVVKELESEKDFSDRKKI